MAKKTNIKERRRIARHERLRKVISGTKDCPRLCVHRSLKNFYAQLIDDASGRVMMGMSTMDKQLHAQLKGFGNINAAKVLGSAFAEKLQKQGIRKVCFDRGGYRYHGRVKAFADATRQGGIEF